MPYTDDMEHQPPSNWRPIQAKAGATLDVAEVFGRGLAVERAWEALLRGENLLLDEPRRFGKTSFLELLVTQTPLRWSVHKVSLQGRKKIDDVAVVLLGAVRQASGTRRSFLEVVSRYISQVETGPVTLSVGFTDRPLDALDNAMRAINSQLEKENEHLLLAIDELTEVVREIGRNESVGTARELLSSLRRIREECPRIRWVLTGSIGFHHVLREIGATDQALNNLTAFTLGPLDTPWATWLSGCVMLDKQGAERPDHEALSTELAKQSDGIPMLIHLAGELLRDEPRSQLTVLDISELLDECFRRADRSANLTHLLTRLDDYYGERTDEAGELLDQTSDGPIPSPSTKTRADRELLDMLIADHYLERISGGQLRWKYPSLARLWRARRSLS
jgi:hypothetical protein